MINPAQLAALSPQKRAQVIYAEAQSQLSTRLWRAALGDGDSKDAREASPFGGNNMNMDSLLGLLGGREGPSGPQASCACHCACNCHQPAAATPAGESAPRVGTTGAGTIDPDEPRTAYAPVRLSSGGGDAAGTGSLQLGPNARYAGTFAAAEARTGIPASALAAIVDAEAAKTGDGSWNTHSRNPRSSAAGLGQFLSGTWQDLAQTEGTWLNSYAAERGWLDGRGRLQTGHRAELLALRYDPQASILGVADLAKCNLDRLEASGVRVRTDSETLAKAAYLGHHLGLGDAKKFLSGGIDAGRARMLLSAQIGSSAAEQRIASTGNATQAHRQWLLGFIDRKIRPDAFAA
ncbi:peptidoglycan-binding protein [Sphingomonas psychrotolerans]|uniref:Peptidoglycan-binding protein n=1 Tax=Sphingomonas psychrotolerans TaxID=1327635 RepID=A0ABU3N3S1_9SPHN|nr:peptidoglycan-binding protein [Sphingomonas psychrotolerans]MDT8758514.1 peptidoglycan-binding protein [Sphingomonas psychrotolerans]